MTSTEYRLLTSPIHALAERIGRLSTSREGKVIAVTLFLVALGWKIAFCFQVPSVTSDVLRHLGYSSHFSEQGFGIYNTTAGDFLPEYWATNWSTQPYIYPPLTLLFFYSFSAFHLGIFWVKVVLTGLDLACAYLFFRYTSPWAALLFFCAPVSVWYGSHEGQYEVLQVLFVMLNAIAVRKRRWRTAGFLLAMSVQIKQFGILIVPWMLYEMWSAGKGRQGILFWVLATRAMQGVLVGIMPFFLFYFNTPNILLLPLLGGSSDVYNPFAWRFWDARLFSWNPIWLVLWNAVFSYLPLVVLVSYVVDSVRHRQFRLAVSAVPLTSFWILVKSLKWGQFWYTIVAPGLVICLPRVSLIHLLLVCHFFQDLHSTVAILARPVGYKESPQSRAVMQSCMFICDPQRTHGPDAAN